MTGKKKDADEDGDTTVAWDLLRSVKLEKKWLQASPTEAYQKGYDV